MIFLAQLFAAMRVRPMLTLCIVLTVILAGVNYPLWQRRIEATREHETMRQKGEFMLHALANRQRIETDLAALRDALGQIEQHLVDERSMEVNLGYFYKLERMSRVRLTRLNQLVALPPPPGSPFKAVPFSMHVSGSYRNSMAFLRALETGPRILRVRSLSLERSATDQDLIFDLTVDVLAKI